MAQSNVSQYELGKVYSTTQINDSTTIALTTGAAIEDVRCRAVKFDASGNVVLAGAGDKIFGVGIITNDVNVAQGDYVDIQYKNIGLVYTGGQFTKGQPLSVDANGCFIAANSTAEVAIALETSGGAGVYVKALILGGAGYGSASPASAGVTSVNGKTGVVTLAASDVGAVPTTRTINSKPLSADVTLTATDVGAEPAQG